MPDPTRAVIYLRVSNDPDGQETSITRHRTDTHALCQRMGWTVIEECVDNDISASRYSRKKRPGWARVLELVDTGAADRIVAWDLDRMLRQPRELEDLIDRAEKGLPVSSISGEVRLDTADGRFISRILVAKAAKESDDLSRRVKRAKLAAAQQGRPGGNVWAFGWTDNGWSIVEEEAEAIRDAARRILAGEIGVTGLAREWNDKGYRRPRSARTWSSTTVRCVMESPRNAGLRQHQGVIIGEAAWPAIIDRVTHERLIRYFSDPARKKGPRRRSTFTGLFRCGSCGTVMRRDQTHGKAIWRCNLGPGIPSCGRAVTASHVDDLIVESLFLAADTGRLGSDNIGVDPAEEKAVTKLQEVEARQLELSDMFAAGEISRSEWLRAKEALTARQEAAMAVIHGSRRASTLDRWREPDALRAAWPSMTPQEQNTILKAVFESVLVHEAVRGGAPADRIERRWRV